MVIKNNNSLLIISVPFGRNTRYLLSSKLYSKLKEEYDILIVSPFAYNDNFRKEFGGVNVSFWTFDNDPTQLNLLARKIYGLTEALRLTGYWFRFRNAKMGYYWRLCVDTNNSEPIGWLKRIIFKAKGQFSGRIGYYNCLWWLIEKFCGYFLYDFKSILQFTRNYKNVILIQSANWGYQERFLAYCARKFSFKSVFVSYSTDQLSVNGFLISDFDKICTQGPIETEYAIKYHNIPLQRILNFGALWFRNIDAIFEENITNRQDNNNKVKNILYGGVASAYFPRDWEFEALDRILAAFKNVIIPNAKLIYRPLPKDDRELKDINSRYQNEDLIEINIPQVSCYGISEYTKSVVKDEVVDYIKIINSADVFIMSCSTTMGFDALYLNKPVISNDACPDAAVPRSRGFLAQEGDTAGLISSGVPVVLSLDELIQKIQQALDSPDSYNQAKKNLLDAWDYQNVNYVNDFMNLISELTA
jgi:hypothetical protein